MGSFNPPTSNTGGVTNSGGSVGRAPPVPPQGFPGSRGEDPRIQQMKYLNGPVAILWDIENCPVPGEVNAEDVAGNVRLALSMHPAFRGAVTMFSAYGDFNHFPRKVREGCQRTGINLIDVPNTKKDASDKAILVDMFLFALDNRPPCTIMLITGDVDFAPALHKLGQRGYSVVLAIPAGFVSASLCSAGRYVWDWASVARGNGLVPAKMFQPRDTGDPVVHQRYPTFSDESGDERFGGGLGPVPSAIPNAPYAMGMTSQSSGEWFPHGYSSPQMGQSPNFPGAPSFGLWNHRLPTPTPTPPPLQQQQQHQGFGGASAAFPSPSMATSTLEAAAEPVSPSAQSTTTFVKPGDLGGLKRQLVKLLSLHGGKMEMLKVPPEYCKMFGRPLYLAEYGSGKLVHLIDRMRDTVCIKGEGSERKVHLTKMGLRMAGRYNKKHRGSTSRASDDQDELDIGEEEEEEGGREVPKEESKSVVEEEVVVYVRKQLDLSRESDSEEQASDHPEAEEELVDEVIEIQEVTPGNPPAAEAGGVEAQAAEAGRVERRRQRLRQELQDLLVSYAYHMVMSDFLTLYRHRYAKEPDYAAFGVDNLEDLLDKVKDVIVVKQGPSGDRRLFANVKQLLLF